MGQGGFSSSIEENAAGGVPGRRAAGQLSTQHALSERRGPRAGRGGRWPGPGRLAGAASGRAWESAGMHHGAALAGNAGAAPPCEVRADRIPGRFRCSAAGAAYFAKPSRIRCAAGSVPTDEDATHRSRLR
ncbi:hypothetical protein GCM10027440_08030 [Nocardiopsis coralliicola]